VVSPDGRSLYAGTYDQNSPLFAFSRATDGTIALLQRVGPFLDGATAPSLFVSPDGGVVYAGGSTAVLHRIAATGRLEPVQALGGDYMTISPDGRDVYAAQSNRLAHFRRDCGDGMLAPSESCDDGNLSDGDGCSSACTQEACWTCAGTPSICTTADDAPCDDGNPCTGDAHCSAGTCASGVTLPDGTVCDDGDACTSGDVCKTGSCVGGDAVACGPCEQCDYGDGCIGLARLTCVSNGTNGPHGVLRITRPQPSIAAAMEWVLQEGGAVTAGDFPDPRVTPYTLCVFDDRIDGGPYPVSRTAFQASLPTGACAGTACWRARDHGGFRFHDAAQDAGIARVVLRPAHPNRTSILVSGHLAASRPEVLPLERVVTAQLWAGDACWTADYELFVRKNSPRRFQAAAGECPRNGCSGD
jgi:cysteine-rich repeat protein